MNPLYLNYGLICFYVITAIAWAVFERDYAQSLYWVSAASITVAVTWQRIGGTP